MGRSQQRGVKTGLINTSFGLDPGRQFLSQKQGLPVKRDLKTADVPQSPLKMPDSEDSEGEKTTACDVRPTTRLTANCGQLSSGQTRRPLPCNDSFEVSHGDCTISENSDLGPVRSRRESCWYPVVSSESDTSVTPSCVSAGETGKRKTSEVVRHSVLYIYYRSRRPVPLVCCDD